MQRTSSTKRSISTTGTACGGIKPHRLPPDGFNPRAASPLELWRYGLPQRPDPAIRPKLAARWDEIFSRKLTYITPTFRPMQELVLGIERQGRPRQDLVTVTHSFWSGAVVHATGSEAFTWVLGQWNVPDIAPPANGQGNWYSIAWIGIDGTSDVTQIGTLQSVSANANGGLSKNCYAFFEWWPNSWQAITNFPVTFGDTVLGLICLQSPTEAWFSLLNVTSGIHAGFTIRCSGRHRLVGKSSRVDTRTAGHKRHHCAIAELRRDLFRLGHGWPWTGLSRRWGHGHGDKYGGERHNSGHYNRRDTDAHQDRLHRQLSGAKPVCRLD